MIAALGVLVFVVLALGFLGGRATFAPAGPVADPSAVRVVDATAQLRALAGSVPFAVRVPATPAGWRSNSVGTDVVADRKAVRVGYLTQSGGYLQLQQSDASEEALLLAAAGTRPMPAQGTQDVGGVRWIAYGTRPDEPVWIADVKGVRLVLTGSATDDEFRTLATAVLAG
jgi:uncharacterized protein DUF4245